jgi:hypothetical protein
MIQDSAKIRVINQRSTGKKCRPERSVLLPYFDQCENQQNALNQKNENHVNGPYMRCDNQTSKISWPTIIAVASMIKNH